ncbi:MAG: hypothetical protein QOG80_1996, partial [Pseudonocardiales bacterium]|nr:hypothetical protein [Pseudonocardiales bacterium]
ENTKASQLTDQTLCTDWKVRDLLNHVTVGGTMFAISAEQGVVPDEVLGPLMTQDQLGEDYRGSVRTAVERAMAAFDQDGIMDKVVTLPFGQMPAGIAMNIAIFDLATHCCDLADATGQRVDDDQLLDAALEIGHGFLGAGRMPELFKPEQPAPPSASAAVRLLAFAGREIS